MQNSRTHSNNNSIKYIANLTYIIEIASECAQGLHSIVQVLQRSVFVVAWQGGLQVGQAVLSLDLSLVG